MPPTFQFKVVMAPVEADLGQPSTPHKFGCLLQSYCFHQLPAASSFSSGLSTKKSTHKVFFIKGTVSFTSNCFSLMLRLLLSRWFFHWYKVGLPWEVEPTLVCCLVVVYTGSHRLSEADHPVGAACDWISDVGSPFCSIGPRIISSDGGIFPGPPQMVLGVQGSQCYLPKSVIVPFPVVVVVHFGHKTFISNFISLHIRCWIAMVGSLATSVGDSCVSSPPSLVVGPDIINKVVLLHFIKDAMAQIMSHIFHLFLEHSIDLSIGMGVVGMGVTNEATVLAELHHSFVSKPDSLTDPIVPFHATTRN
ncbi:hypothetical protein COLO4_29874 [Corchorus olitorius]|uniref:Uncharacterized protein n=1 Tax=Corchorus olitorius TaxID=93759 RepID=A0A1R3HCQ8_9ROSI|nr:hypothetical protein COLO4_29874 [Corchorus olitorius]